MAFRRKRREAFAIIAPLLCAAFVGIQFLSMLHPNSPERGGMVTGRFLAADNTTVVSNAGCQKILDRPFDRDYPGLAVTLYVIGILFVFLGIAIVCDDHFCVSLEIISEKLELDEHVAGATFMAAGSSAPELATSLVTIFTTKDSTGVGTILGSAVFNLVMIVCVSGYFGTGPSGEAKKRCERAIGRSLPDGLFLDYRPLARDALFYVCSIILVVIFALTKVSYPQDPEIDGKPGFEWWEGLILTLCYGIYVHAMIKNRELMNWFSSKFGVRAHIAEYAAVRHGEQEQSLMLEEGAAGAAALHKSDSFALKPPTSGSDDGSRGAPVAIYGAFKDATTNLTSQQASPGGAAVVDEAAIELVEPAVADKVSDAHDEEDDVSEMSPNVREIARLVDGMKTKGDNDELLLLVAKELVHLNNGVRNMRSELLPIFRANEEDYMQLEEEEGEPSSPASCSSRAKSLLSTAMRIISAPWDIAFKITIPACERNSFQASTTNTCSSSRRAQSFLLLGRS